MVKKRKLPIISTSTTSGLTNIMQLTDVTSNELFAIRDSTSVATYEIFVKIPLIKETGKEKEEEESSEES